MAEVIDLAGNESDEFEIPLNNQGLNRPRNITMTEGSEALKENTEAPNIEKELINHSNDEEEEDNAEGCPICFEPWTSGGLHRVSSLKCGHLFGKHCIETWLSNANRAKCPQCNLPATRKDIRVLFVKRLSAVDTSEKDTLFKQLEEEKTAKRRAEENLSKLRLNYNLALAEITLLQEEIKRLRCVNVMELFKDPLLFRFKRSITFEPSFKSRLLAFDSNFQMFTIGMQIGTRFGLGKISLFDDSRIDILRNLHSQVIKDVVWSPFGDGLVLTTSMDKTLSLNSLNSNSKLITYQLNSPGWSCCFDQKDCNYQYVGIGNGSILIYDVRKTDGYLQSFTPPGSPSPIHRIFVKSCEGEYLQFYLGTLAGPRTFRYSKTDQQVDKLFYFPSPSCCNSFLYNLETDCWLASYRGNQTQYHFGTCSEDEMTFPIVHSWTSEASSAGLLRPSFCSSSNGIHIAYPEGSECKVIHLANKGQPPTLPPVKISSNSPSAVTDCILSSVDMKIHLGLLTERQLSLFNL